MFGGAARHHALAAHDVRRAEAARQQGDALDRAIREHPGVLAAAAPLAGDQLALAAADAREAAVHHRVVAAAIRDEEHPQHERAALETPAAPDSRLRQRHALLENEA